jgi:hypothetical protein
MKIMCDISVGIRLGYGLDDRVSRVRFPAGLGIFLFNTSSTTALGPTQPPIKWVPGALSLGVKRLGREADHSPSSSAEVQECVDLYLHSPNTASWRGAQSKIKHRDNYTFYLYVSYFCPQEYKVLQIYAQVQWIGLQNNYLLVLSNNHIIIFALKLVGKCYVCSLIIRVVWSGSKAPRFRNLKYR